MVGKIRSIKPDYFMDEDLARITEAARLTFVGLWTLADREGRLEDRPQFIRANLFPYEPEKKIDGILKELEKKPFICRYSVGERKYIQIINFLKHQRPHHTERPSVLPPPHGEFTVGSRLIHGEYPEGKEVEGKGMERKGGNLSGVDPGNGAGSNPPISWAKAISWNKKDGCFEGITPEMIGNWKEAYPAVNLGAQLKRADEWLKANPNKLKKNYYRFITNWLGRSQERGGK